MLGRKKINNVGGSQGKRGFSFVELIVTIAIIGVLMMLGTPRIMGYVERAELARIQYDVKIMEDKMAEDSINGVKDFAGWDDNAKDLGLLVLADLLYETEGKANSVAKPRTQYEDVASSQDILSELEEVSDYKIMPEHMSNRIKTQLPGTFYTNVDGKVYYEHDKPLTRVKEYQKISCESALPDYTFEHETGKIVKYHGNAQHLVIPPAFNVDERCYPVLIIGKGAFMHGNYREVVVPETVITIEDDAFKDVGLESISIPGSVTHVGAGAFVGNNFGGGSGSGSGGISISNSPGGISVGYNGWGGATPSYGGSSGKGSDYTFNPSTGTISGGKTNGPVLRIPATITVNNIEYPVRRIEKGSYQGKGLTTVILPEGLEIIEDYAFAGNQLIGITIPNSVNHIGNYAFAFNELEKVGNISGPPTKSTIKTITIKDSEQFNKLDKYGDILEGGTKVDIYKNENIEDEVDVMLMKHIFVTSYGNVIIEVGDGTIGGTSGGFTDEEIQELIDKGYVPISTSYELESLGIAGIRTFGKSTKWEDSYAGGLNKKYIQVAHIDLSSIDNFKPISAFSGIYNGGNFTINNLKIDRGSSDNVGMFGSTTGKIDNVGLINVDIQGRSFVGGLVGNSGNVINNSYVTGNILGNGNMIGGLVGHNNYSKVTNSYTTVNVKGNNNVGGLIGRTYIGGVITNSHTTGNITGNTNVGGLLGYIHSGTVNNSYFGGEVMGDDYVGGLIGYNNQNRLSNSYSTGRVKSDGIYVGGIIGARSQDQVTNSYYDKDTSGMGDTGKGIGLSTEQMKQQLSYTGWDFDSIWQISPGQYPTLQWQN